MFENEIVSSEYKSFEDIKRKRDDGSEYWLARELQKALEYAKWENFSKVIDRAMLACKNAGFEASDLQKDGFLRTFWPGRISLGKN